MRQFVFSFSSLSFPIERVLSLEPWLTFFVIFLLFIYHIPPLCSLTDCCLLLSALFSLIYCTWVRCIAYTGMRRHNSLLNSIYYYKICRWSRFILVKWTTCCPLPFAHLSGTYLVLLQSAVRCFSPRLTQCGVLLQ